MEDFIYRKAFMSDISVLVEAEMNAYLERYEWDAKMQTMLRESFSERFPRRMKNGTLVIYLAYQGAIFVGMGGLEIWPMESLKGTANLSTFYTVPKFRGQGVMRHLFELLVKVAKESGVTVIKTCEIEDNRQRLYHLGFQDIYDTEEDGTFGLSDEMELVFHE